MAAVTGAQIRALREAKGLSLLVASARAGVTMQTWQWAESERRPPTVGTLNKILAVVA